MKTTITIQTPDGPQEVEATVYGHLAVHRTPDWNYLWTVTHVASGMSVKANIQPHRRAQRVAKDLGKDPRWAQITLDPKDTEGLKVNHALREAFHRALIDGGRTEAHHAPATEGGGATTPR